MREFLILKHYGIWIDGGYNPNKKEALFATQAQINHFNFQVAESPPVKGGLAIVQS